MSPTGELRVSKDCLKLDDPVGNASVTFSNGHFYVIKKVRVEQENLPKELQNVDETALKTLLATKGILVLENGKNFILSLTDKKGSNFTWKKKIVLSIAGGVAIGICGGIIPGIVIGVGGSVFTVLKEALTSKKPTLTPVSHSSITTNNSLPPNRPKMDSSKALSPD